MSGRTRSARACSRSCHWLRLTCKALVWLFALDGLHLHSWSRGGSRRAASRGYLRAVTIGGPSRIPSRSAVAQTEALPVGSSQSAGDRTGGISGIRLEPRPNLARLGLWQTQREPFRRSGGLLDREAAPVRSVGARIGPLWVLGGLLERKPLRFGLWEHQTGRTAAIPTPTLPPTPRGSTAAHRRPGGSTPERGWPERRPPHGPVPRPTGPRAPRSRQRSRPRRWPG